MTAFVEHTTTRLAVLNDMFINTRKQIIELKIFFGENIPINLQTFSMNINDNSNITHTQMHSNDVCISKSFFEMVVSFASKYANAAKDISFWKDQVCVYSCI